MPRPSDAILTAAQMRAAEQALIQAGTSVDELMRRAGRGAAEYVWRMAAGRAVTVLCGPGNNGGDGYVIAETLRARGLPVTVIAAMEPKTEAARNARAAWQGEVRGPDAKPRGDVFVDCLFGSGLKRALSDELAALVERLARTHHHAVAIDLPSNIDSDSGQCLGPVPRYDLTVALGAWKWAHWTMPATARMGALRLVGIGVDAPERAGQVIGRPHLAAPTADSHKYRRGLVAVVAGAMPGAAALAAIAAQHGGAGYVKLLAERAPAGLPHSVVFDDRPLTQALPDERIAALLCGPGLGRDQAARARLEAVLERGGPTVLDADALMLLEAGDLADAGHIVLTPHEGELARLAKVFDASPSVTGKLDTASAIAQATGATVIAKGADTLVVQRGRAAVAPPASSWLSTAGTGDVLAGIVASRLATGAEPFTAACEAVWLHGEAARLAGAAFSADALVGKVAAAYAAAL
jgi:ADP-dependent NAD(P)H-hydrate dehydratase / NAD(P)H-hydrate epimerase